MTKYDPEIVMEFYENARPTEEGIMDKRSKVRGQWIPYEEGQQCEYTERRSQFTGLDEEAIGQLLCFLGHDFV